MDTIETREDRRASSRVYAGFVLATEILVYFVKTFVLYLYGVYRLIFPPEETSVSGEIVLITGTGHGIGKELAKQYGELGAKVVCVDINKDSNQETVEELKKLGITAHCYICDVSSRDEVLQLSKKVLAEVGDVSILVNNAGIMPCKSFLSHKPEDIYKMFAINIFAHFWMAEAFLPTMLKNNKGHIVGISSIAGLLGCKNVVPYSASKFAVRGFMEGLAEEYRKTSSKIRFTTVYPFITDTGLCKNPRIRFRSYMKILSPSETASQIITAQRRQYPEAGVPPYIYFTNTYARNLPISCRHLLLDLLDAGLDPHN